MTQTIEAVFKDGIFELLDDIVLKLEEGEKVTIVIKTADHEEESHEQRAEKYFEGMSEEDIDNLITRALSRRR